MNTKKIERRRRERERTRKRKFVGLYYLGAAFEENTRRGWRGDRHPFYFISTSSSTANSSCPYSPTRSEKQGNWGMRSNQQPFFKDRSPTNRWGTRDPVLYIYIRLSSIVDGSTRSQLAATTTTTTLSLSVASLVILMLQAQRRKLPNNFPNDHRPGTKILFLSSKLSSVYLSISTT